MNKKLILSSLATTALLAACTSEELVPQANEAADVFASRPKIDVAFGVDAPSTRMTGTDEAVKYDTKDNLGAVLVDQGKVTPENYFDLVTANTHIGNNKFYYEAPKFVTDGTMCVGAWLFYANYDKANTSSRGSIKYKMPIVQEYAQDFKEIANHDFKFSPIVNLVGSEDGRFNEFNIPTISAFTYANVKLHFDKDVVVQKLVLKPYDKDAATGTKNYDPFYGTYELNMGNGSDNSGLSCAVADLNKVPHYTGETKQDCLNAATSKLLSKKDYISATVGSGTANKQIVALNCLDSELAPSKDFQTLMVIPSGQYEGIRLYAYTDKGVYVYNINDEFEAIATDKRNASHAADNTGILLKRERVSLHNIADLKSEGDAVFAAANKYLNMTEVKTHQQLQTAEETEGIVVISQKDLLTVINSIGVKGNHIIRVLGNMVKIDENVAKAIADKEKQLNGDIQLIFANFYDYENNQSIAIEGNAEGYTLTDVTFQILAKQTSGKVKLGADINIPAGSSYTVGNGATAEIVENANKTASYEYDKFINNGTLIGNSEDVVINIIENNAAVEFKKDANVTNLKNIDKATAKVETGATLTAAVNNISCDKNHVHGGAVVTNDGTINLNGTSVNNAASKINNNGIIQIKNITWTNNGTIENAKDAKIISGDAHNDGGKFMNTTSGNITNYGFMYCYNGENFIYNEGTINAKAGSTTYITRNSREEEAVTETRSNTMGTINMDTRNEDISVTSTKFQGYLTFTTDLAEIKNVSEDKFNKVILSNANATVDDAKVKYVVTSGAKLTVKNNAVQELIFKNNCTLITNTATVAYLEIAGGKIVKLPTENVIAIENISTTETSTKANINNNGTLLVGGDLWSSAIVDCPTKGIFASGDGTKTAFHWGQGK